jgi:hypothetical protein
MTSRPTGPTASSAAVLRALPEADVERVMRELESRPAHAAVTLYADLYRLEARCSVGTMSTVSRVTGTERLVVSMRDLDAFGDDVGYELFALRRLIDEWERSNDHKCADSLGHDGSSRSS